MHANTIDLRDLANEWRAEIANIDNIMPGTDIYGDAYGDLCDDLGIDRNPDSLEAYANDYAPTLISADYFPEYARELAEDCGMVSRANEWPLSYIDWERAADVLAQDYTEVEYDGQTYYICA